MMGVQFENKAAATFLVLCSFICINSEAVENRKESSIKVTLVGESVHFTCSADASINIQWYRNGFLISTGEIIFSPYHKHFNLQKDSNSGVINLFLQNATAEDHGVYRCGDSESKWKDSSVTLIVLDSNPTCSSIVNLDGFIGPNICNVEQEEMIFSCSVLFYGYKPPQLMWNLLNHSAVFNESQCNYSNNRINCTTAIKADSMLDGSVFTCQAAKTIGQYSCSTSIITVQYFDLKNDSTSRKYIGDETDCVVKTNKAATFYWKHTEDLHEKVINNNHSLMIKESGLYRCYVEYEIGNHKCLTLVSTVYVLDDDKRVCIVVGVLACLLILIIAIVICFMREVLIQRKLRCMEENFHAEGMLLVHRSNSFKAPVMSHAEMIQKHNDTLLRCTNINNDVIGCLKEKMVIHFSQESNLRREQCPFKRAEIVYKWLKQCENDDKYKAFLQVTKDVGQEHVANLLEGNVEKKLQPLSELRYAGLLTIWPKLIQSLEVGEKLLACLLENKAISETDFKEIRAQNVVYLKRSLLVGAILRRSNSAFDCFKQALIDTRQRELADCLYEEEGIVDSLRKSEQVSEEDESFMLKIPCDIYGSGSVRLSCPSSGFGEDYTEEIDQDKM